jgi:hypothetical protein
MSQAYAIVSFSSLIGIGRGLILLKNEVTMIRMAFLVTLHCHKNIYQLSVKIKKVEKEKIFIYI